MKAQISERELRVGNIVNKLFADTGQYDWSYFRAEEFAELKQYPNNFQPIELNEEWLVKVGAVLKNNYWIVKYHEDTVFSVQHQAWRGDWTFYIRYTDSPFEEDENKEYPLNCDLKYLHSLQNLYFALTGQELSLKVSGE